jgi:hypothetical protein
VTDTGVIWERLTSKHDPTVDALLVTYPPASSSSSGDALTRHTGYECGFLVSGRPTLLPGFESFALEPGFSISFDSATPHAYVHQGSEPACGIWHVVGHAHAAVPTPAALHEVDDGATTYGAKCLSTRVGARTSVPAASPSHDGDAKK